METPGANSYDAVPYPSLPIRRTHPCYLAAIARLFGLDPPGPRRCRVLELGCASGGNLLPMAADLPDSSFLGVDYSAREVAEGQSAVRAVGLANLEIRQADVADFPTDAGQFDYIVCHGVYSWVPARIQEHILQIGRRHLSPRGLFYVSYNAYPGWHLRGVVRDMMRYHVRRIDEPATRIAQARLLLETLVKMAAPPSESYRQLLRDEAAIVSSHADAYLYHEHLEDENQPLYFYQFIERLAGTGLQYVADAEFSTMIPSNFGREAAALLRDAPFLAREQYLDFLCNRAFRMAILCRDEQTPTETHDSRRLDGCRVTLEERLQMPPPGADGGDGPSVFGTQHEEITVTAPYTKAALVALNEAWPDGRSFEELVSCARGCAVAEGRQLADEASHRRRLAEDLVTLLSRRLLRATVDGPACATRPSQRPQATPVARWQATRPDGVTNRRHEHHKLSDLNRCLLARLDGQHDRAALAEVLRQAVVRGDFEIRREGQLVSHPDGPTLHRIVDHSLAELAGIALLVA